MLLSPQNVIFETPEDLVDFVSLGLPPTRRQYQTMRAMLDSAVSYHSANAEYLKDKPENAASIEPTEREAIAIEHIVIDFSKINLGTQDDFTRLLDRVYANNKKNRNMAAGACAGSFAAGLLIGVLV